VQSECATAVEGAAAVSWRRHGHSRTTVAIVWGVDGTPVEVLCDPATDPPGQRWFSVVLDDAEGPDGPSQAPVCVGCLLDQHPMLGRGLDVALEHRGAKWRDGEWVAAPELYDE
jgi:hypothetical protein